MSDNREQESVNAPAGPEFVCLDQMQKLRACFRCHLVKTQNQFRDNGCENCPFFKSHRFTYLDYTSANFESLISIIDPQSSWVALHLGVQYFIPGTYCRKIRDVLSEDMLYEVRKNGINVARNPS